jgi:hypothetical protein
LAKTWQEHSRRDGVAGRLGPVHSGEGPPRRTSIAAEVEVVVDDGDTVGCEMDIQLDAVSAELDGPAERGQCVLRKFPRRAAMGDAFDAAS